MEFFDKVKTTAAEVCDAAGKKSKELYATARLKIEIGEKQKSVKNLYKEIGFDAYKAYRAEVDVLEHIMPKFKEIDVLEGEIAQLKEKCEALRTVQPAGVDDAVENPVTEEAVTIVSEEDTEPIEPIE